MPDRFDVAIVGGGPAGSTAAIALAGAGYSVLLLEAGAWEDERVGETVAPQVPAILDEMGLGEEFHAQGHGRGSISRAAWERDELRQMSVVEDARGARWWHLDRKRFDVWMAGAAAKAGADVRTGCRLQGLSLADDGDWILEAASSGERLEVRARFAIDASGRRCRVGRRLGARRIRHDNQVGVACFPAASADEQAKGYYLLTEAMEGGWWYTALLPGGRLVAIFMTDGDLVPDGGEVLRRFWHEQRERSRHARERIGPATDVGIPRVHPANSSRLQPLAGPGWAAIGDAALTFDPITGFGVWHALDSARRAAYAASAWLEGSPAELDEYSREEADVFDEYLAFYPTIYGRNRRWPDAAYWRRRTV